MRSTFNYNFYVRASKAKDNLAPIEMSISINGKRVFIQLPYKCNPTDFNKKRKPKEIERYLDAQRVTINKIVTEMAENGIPLTADALRHYFRTGGFRSYTAEDLFNDYLKIQKMRIGKTLTKGVYMKYEYVRDLFFQTFNKENESTAITNAAVRTFYTLLDNRYQNSTACGYKTKFGAFIRYGLDNQKIKINPLQGLKISRERKPITYLTEEEIEKLKNTPIDNECLSRVRDCAIFQLSSGLAYSDCVSLQPTDLQEKDGTYYIRKRRNKTGNYYMAVIFPDGKKVWDKYNGRLPFVSNQKYNLFLKSLALRCGIEKNITTHIFRHTYATTLLNSGISLKITSACIGDTISVCNQFYAHLKDETILKEVSKVI